MIGMLTGTLERLMLKLPKVGISPLLLPTVVGTLMVLRLQ